MVASSKQQNRSRYRRYPDFPKKPRKTFQQRYDEWSKSTAPINAVRDWCQTNDKALWGCRWTITAAFNKCRHDTQLASLNSMIFNFHVLNFCNFFLSRDWRGYSAPSAITALSDEQWHKLHMVLHKIFAEHDLFQPDATLDFIVRLCRYYGAPASRTILGNCSVFKILSKGRFC